MNSRLIGITAVVALGAVPKYALPASLPPTQLYEARGSSVVAYALNADGLPATTPTGS